MFTVIDPTTGPRIWLSVVTLWHIKSQTSEKKEKGNSQNLELGCRSCCSISSNPLLYISLQMSDCFAMLTGFSTTLVKVIPCSGLYIENQLALQRYKTKWSYWINWSDLVIIWILIVCLYINVCTIWCIHCLPIRCKSIHSLYIVHALYIETLLL